MSRKKGIKNKKIKVKEVITPEVKPEIKSDIPFNSVKIIISIGKNSVSYEIDANNFKRDYLKIWDDANAKLDELNAL